MPASPSIDNSLQSRARLVLTKLPLELRNHVYSYVWDGVIHDIDYQGLSRLTKNSPATSEHSEDSLQGRLESSIPRFARKQITGPEFMREAVDWLYNNYDGFVLRGAFGIGSFLSADVFQVGLSPATAKIRRLEVVFKLVHRSWSTSPQIRNWEELSNFEEFSKIKKISLRPDFQLLVTFDAQSPTNNCAFSFWDVFGISDEIDQYLADLEETSKIRLAVQYKHDLCAGFDLKPIMGAPQLVWEDYLCLKIFPKVIESPQLVTEQQKRKIQNLLNQDVAAFHYN